MWRKKLIKGIIFVVIFAVLFSCASKILTTPGDYRNYQWIAGFYEEKEDSLDAVYIGSSTGYAYWNPLMAWEQYGIAVYPYTNNSQHFITTEYLIKEVHKTQPNALIIVNTNTIADRQVRVEDFHYLLDYMPFSFNKLQLTNYLVETAGFGWEEALELYVPLYRYHDRWNEVNSQDLNYQVDGLKGACNYSTYLRETTDLTDIYAYSDERAPLETYISDAAVSLMDYCEQENVRILFVTVPRAESEKRIQQINELNAMLEARGFDTLNLLKQPELCGIDITRDFYNKGHTNIHGAVKYTAFLSEYMIEHYGFTNKHGDADYASWDAGVKKYEKTLKKHTLDIEFDIPNRTDRLEAPTGLAAAVSDAAVNLSWDAVEGADGYALYRKGSSVWERLAISAEPAFVDTSVETGKEYDYIVVPYAMEADQTIYGKFDYQGIPVPVE